MQADEHKQSKVTNLYKYGHQTTRCLQGMKAERIAVRSPGKCKGIQGLPPLKEITAQQINIKKKKNWESPTILTSSVPLLRPQNGLPDHHSLAVLDEHADSTC